MNCPLCGRTLIPGTVQQIGSAEVRPVLICPLRRAPHSWYLEDGELKPVVAERA